MSDSVRPHRRQPTRLLCPWDSSGKNTGVGCHFLLQCMKVKVKSLSRAQLLVTPWTAAYQAPPSMGFSRQEYWSGLPLPSLCMHAKSLQSCLTLFDPMDCSPPGCSGHRILQDRILEWVAMPSSRDLPDPEIEPKPHYASFTGRRETAPPGKPHKPSM